MRAIGLVATNPAGLSLTADSGGFRLTGVDGASSYHLELSSFSSNATHLFHHADVPLEAGATHLIQPDWATLGDGPVTIDVDLDGDGQKDESLVMANQAPSTTIWPGWVGGLPELRIEARLTPLGVREFRVAIPASGTVQLEFSQNLIDWSPAGMVAAGAWLSVASLPDLPPDSPGPVYLRIQR